MAESPDVVILCADRLVRAPLRAQLIEDGFEVVATDTWSMMRPRLRPGVKPLLVIVDLQALPDPAQVLSGVGVLMNPERVIVLTALGSIDADAVERGGYVVVRRPVSIAEIVDTARAVRAGAISERR
jgi:hypothetical protein